MFNLRIVCILVLGVGLSGIFVLGHRLVVDSMQLLERAFLFSQGYLVPFGPRSTNTNLIYGSFISIYNGIFFWFSQSPYSVMVGILVFQLVGFWLLTRTQVLKIDRRFYLIYLFLFWCSPWRSSEIFIWNPSFLFTLATLFLYSIDLFLRGKRFSATLLQILSVALTMQIHNSFIFLGFLGLALWWKKISRPHWGAAALGFGLTGVLFAPTLWVIARSPQILDINTEGGAMLFANLLKGGEALKGILYWVRYPSFYFSSTTMDIPKFDDLVLFYLWEGLKWLMAMSSVIFVIFANWKFFWFEAPDSALRVIAKWAFVSLTLSSCISPVPFNFWHLYLVYPFALIPVAKYLSLRPLSTKSWVLVGLYFLTFTLISSHKSYKHDWSEHHRDRFETMLQSREGLIENYRIMAIELTGRD